MQRIFLNKSVQLLASAVAIRLFVLTCIAVFLPAVFSDIIDWYDVRSYISIAESFPVLYGAPCTIECARHYPLFPFFVYLFSLLLPGAGLLLSAHAVAVLASSLSVPVFYHISKRFTDKAFELSLIFCCFPPKWLAVSTFPWSEPVFMLFLMLSLLLLLREQLLASFLLIGLAAVARPVGIVFVAPMFLYIVLFRREETAAALRFCIVAAIPFVLYHLLLFYRFDQFLLLIHGTEGGDWGGHIFSLPLQGLMDGVRDASLTTLRKVYTPGIFLFYCAACIVAVRRIKEATWAFLSLWFLPYFVFTCFLKGAETNWWMVSFPRLALPVAPAGLILLGDYCSPRQLRYAAIAGAVAGVVYSIGTCLLRDGALII